MALSKSGAAGLRSIYIAARKNAQQWGLSSNGGWHGGDAVFAVTGLGGSFSLADRLYDAYRHYYEKALERVQAGLDEATYAERKWQNTWFHATGNDRTIMNYEREVTRLRDETEHLRKIISAVVPAPMLAALEGR